MARVPHAFAVSLAMSGVLVGTAGCAQTGQPSGWPSVGVGALDRGFVARVETVCRAHAAAHRDGPALEVLEHDLRALGTPLSGSTGWWAWLADVHAQGRLSGAQMVPAADEPAGRPVTARGERDLEERMTVGLVDLGLGAASTCARVLVRREVPGMTPVTASGATQPSARRPAPRPAAASRG